MRSGLLEVGTAQAADGVEDEDSSEYVMSCLIAVDSAILISASNFLNSSSIERHTRSSENAP